jgi:hypothetical protein
MVGHQTVRVHCAFVLFGQLAQVRQIDQVITVLSEARRAVVSALDDVDGYAGKYQPRWPGHSRQTGVRRRR